MAADVVEMMRSMLEVDVGILRMWLVRRSRQLRNSGSADFARSMSLGILVEPS